MGKYDVERWLSCLQIRQRVNSWAAIIHRLIQQGKGLFKKIKNGKELVKNIGMLYAFPVAYTHVVACANSGIKSLKDIKGKNVFIGSPGSGILAWPAGKAVYRRYLVKSA